MIRISLLSLLVLLALFPRTGLGAPQSSALDVNDVSVLFPLRADSRLPYPELRLNQQAWGGQPLLGAQIAKDLVDVLKAQSPASVDPGSFQTWRVLGFRYDPCAPGISARNGSFSRFGIDRCIQQLRLIAQPIGPSGAIDFSLHLVYELGRGVPAERDPTLSALIAWKALSQSATGVSTWGKGLQVHPGLKAELQAARGNQAALALRSFILSRVSQRNLARVTVSAQGLDERSFWYFFGGDISRDSMGTASWSLGTIPNIAGSQVQRFLFAPGSSFISPVPAGVGAVSTHALVLAVPDVLAGQSFGPIPAGLRDVLSDIDNPRRSHTANRDCVSCHTSTALALGFNALPGIPSDFRPSAGVTGFVRRGLLSPAVWSIRTFGYFEGEPALSIRAVNDSAETASFINTQILRVRNPGPDCSARFAEVWSCYLRDGRMGATDASVDRECLALCRRR